ncbi:MAG TPA: RNA ligase partner protein [Candidatus Methanoperedenaceae archaeon]|nr:RNA ligase partner protein [Candidatus Methanoperedenaceae archaeon]
MMRQRFVLDTSALTDAHTHEMEPSAGICVVMNTVLDVIADARLNLDISCYIPYPSVYNELREIVNNNTCGDEALAKIDTWLVKKTPDRYEVKIPSKIFYEYVDYMRGRINKGMGVAEDAIWESATESMASCAKKRDKTEIERDVIGGIVNKFREKYRNALRYGILDSAPDIDVLLLAKELDAAVVAGDVGIQKWAEQLGLRFVDSKSFPSMIKEYLRRVA